MLGGVLGAVFKGVLLSRGRYYSTSNGARVYVAVMNLAVVILLHTGMVTLQRRLDMCHRTRDYLMAAN